MHEFVEHHSGTYTYCKLCGLTLITTLSALDLENINYFKTEYPCQKRIIINASHHWKQLEGLEGLYWVCEKCGYKCFGFIDTEEGELPWAEISCEEQIMRKALE